MSARIHDLLEVDTRALLEANVSAPLWVAESLSAAPFVVVRRGLISPEGVPIGVRGEGRGQRWAGTCDPGWIRAALTPAELLLRFRASLRNTSGSEPLDRDAALRPWLARVEAIPALRSLALLASDETWSAFPHAWGPGGSVGFELASGRPTAGARSDLDLVIYAAERLGVADAKCLHAAMNSLTSAARRPPSAVDVRVETPFCGFSLTEYVTKAPTPILLRTVSGVMLGSDPWDGGSCSGARMGELVSGGTGRP